ncbi:hypothetical protein DERF_002180 [Dermatophagoides farinae]|uniref:Uncharacterized protein n=1 Tax=Dermatophagoides farinae TaxID=6954 RepID=A0A922LA80_DERFA|nr:hypothetical protein DERF_002180 [Dermatophagoides farinae]
MCWGGDKSAMDFEDDVENTEKKWLMVPRLLSLFFFLSEKVEEVEKRDSAKCNGLRHGGDCGGGGGG